VSLIGGAVLQAGAVCCFVVIVTFLLVRIVPGDPVTAIAGTRASSEARQALREQLHLDRSLPDQFGAYARDLSRGDFGHSLVQQQRPAISIVGDTLPVTLYLVAATIVLSVLAGVPLGLFAALRPGAPDVSIRAFATVLLAVPPFFLGLLLILFFALKVPLFPAGGWGSGWPDNLRFLVLPSVALSAYLMPLVTSVTRQTARSALTQPWVEAATARGLTRRRILFRHVLRNSVSPVITLVGYNAGYLVAGAVIVESVFGLPGIGQALVNAVSVRDYPVIQAIALVSALGVVVCNLLADLLALAADPRIGVASQ
jgi:peptide/nickel transport system permease protein